MDLSLPLRSLVPSLDSVVLDVLAGTESGLTLAQIARIGDRGSRQGLALVLDRLVEHGLVHAEPAGRGHLYRLNRDHVLAEAVLSASGARAVLLQRIARAAAALVPTPTHVSAFGSFARREGGPDSDIDMLAVLPDAARADEQWHEQLRDLADLVHNWSGNRLECIGINEQELRALARRREPIVEAWLSDSITVYGVPLETLISGSSAGPTT